MQNRKLATDPRAAKPNPIQLLTALPYFVFVSIDSFCLVCAGSRPDGKDDGAE